MNIIELFENAGIYRENLKEFTFDDTVKVQKQFEIERTQNPNLNPSLQSNLILAINEFPKEILFISNNRVLYNFFAKKNYSRNRFSSDNNVSVGLDAVKSFIERFLTEEIDSFFNQKMEQNRFDEIDDFLIVKEYLPQNSLHKLNAKLLDKCDFVLNKLDENPPVAETISINFIRHRSFYDLLTHFSSIAMDEKVKLIYAKMTSTLVNFEIKSEFLNPMMISMGNYKALDNDLASTLKFNKDQTTANTQRTSSSNSSALSTGGMIALAIIVIRLILLMVRCSNT
jgi:hypothetical protein